MHFQSMEVLNRFVELGYECRNHGFTLSFLSDNVLKLKRDLFHRRHELMPKCGVYLYIGCYLFYDIINFAVFLKFCTNM